MKTGNDRTLNDSRENEASLKRRPTRIKSNNDYTFDQFSKRHGNRPKNGLLS